MNTKVSKYIISIRHHNEKTILHKVSTKKIELAMYEDNIKII